MQFELHRSTVILANYIINIVMRAVTHRGTKQSNRMHNSFWKRVTKQVGTAMRALITRTCKKAFSRMRNVLSVKILKKLRLNMLKF